jgi:hypothetical protein
MKYLLLFIALFLSSLFCLAQSYTPLELTKKLLSKEPFPKAFCSGEFDGHPNGADFASDVRLTVNRLMETDKDAMINVTITRNSQQFDSYIFFKKDTVWKVSAFRALAMTGIIEKVNAELKALSPHQVDSVIAVRHTSKKDSRMFKSREEYQYLLGNTDLTLASDSILISHFIKNKNAFEQVKAVLVTKNVTLLNKGTRDMKGIDAIRKQLQLLFIDNVYSNNNGTKNSLSFLIGGILDNAVGYMYVPNKADLPKMTPSGFILVREIGNGWYLYKTT